MGNGQWAIWREAVMTAQAAIGRLRRDLALSATLKWLLLGTAIAATLLLAGDWLQVGVLTAIGFVWLVLTWNSRRGSVLAAESTQLIAAGDFDAAEQQLEQAMRSFSLFRTSKLLSLHQLAVLRHKQRQWQESAALNRALLTQRLGALRNLQRPARLMLAEAQLETNDVAGAYQSLSALYDQRLSLGEALHLLKAQLEYESRIGAWPHMAANLPVKVQLAELMPAYDAGATQALLALAARKVGRADWEQWLCERAALLADVQELVVRKPQMRELWA
jgi:hypothetical protein